jgi:GntR family transcriptional regulator
MTGRVGPSYQRVADDLRSQIGSGKLAIGDPIPSTAGLMKLYEVSSTVVRRAVAELQAEGLVYGQPGKAVYVQATPADVEADQVSTEALRQQFGELRAEVQGPVRDALGVMEANLMDLYGKLGFEYPRPADSPAEHETPAGRRDRPA